MSGKVNLEAVEVLSVIPELRGCLEKGEAIRALAGKGELREVQAFVSLCRYMREDAIRDCCQPDLSERQAGFYAGEVNALAQLEEWLLNCVGLGMGAELEGEGGES